MTSLIRINDTAFALEIPMQMQLNIMNNPDSFVINYNKDSGKFEIFEFIDSDRETLEQDPRFFPKDSSEQIAPMDPHNPSKEFLESIMAPKIPLVKEKEKASVEPAGPSGTSSTSNLSLLPIGQKRPLQSENRYKQLLHNPVTCKSLTLTDFSLNVEQFDAKVYFVFKELFQKHGNLFNYFISKINPSSQLRVGGSIAESFDLWWKNSTADQKIILLSTPKSSGGLTTSVTAQRISINSNISDDIKDRLMQGVPLFRSFHQDGPSGSA